jgi:spore germination protein GerM
MMQKKIIIISSLICVSLLSGVFLILFLFGDGGEIPEPTAITDSAATYGETEVFLYFADRTRPYLTAEARKIETQETACKFAEKIIKALIPGSIQGNINTIPANTGLRAFYITPDQMAVVDLSVAVNENHPGGCRTEQLTLFSIVNSLILNIPEIKKVKLIIEGRETETLAGHIDISEPFTADMLLVR